MKNSKERGFEAETAALKYLKKNGLKLITRNFHCRYGEIDLIMSDKDSLVFIEVKHRVSSSYGGALYSVTPTKQNKLRRTAETFIQQRKAHHLPCRFDILCFNGPLNTTSIDWIQNAF